jgi:hypothetical protein
VYKTKGDQVESEFEPIDVHVLLDGHHFFKCSNVVPTVHACNAVIHVFGMKFQIACKDIWDAIELFYMSVIDKPLSPEMKDLKPYVDEFVPKEPAR